MASTASGCLLHRGRRRLLADTVVASSRTMRAGAHSPPAARGAPNTAFSRRRCSPRGGDRFESRVRGGSSCRASAVTAESASLPACRVSDFKKRYALGRLHSGNGLERQLSASFGIHRYHSDLLRLTLPTR